MDRDGLRSLKSTSNLGEPSFDAVNGNAKYDLRVNIPQIRGLAGEFFSNIIEPCELNIGDF